MDKLLQFINNLISMATMYKSSTIQLLKDADIKLNEDHFRTLELEAAFHSGQLAALDYVKSFVKMMESKDAERIN